MCLIIYRKHLSLKYSHHLFQLFLNALERLNVPTIRYTAKYVAEHGRTVDGRYFVDDKEVAVFFLRTLYDPSHFVTEDIWRVLRDIELSKAISVSLRTKF